MKVFNTKKIENFEDVLNRISKNLNLNVDYKVVSNNCYNVKLRLDKTKKYQRTGYMTCKNGKKNKVNAVCWHGYRDFMIELYKINHNFRIKTCDIYYQNKEDFYNRYQQTGYQNIGSMVEPIKYKDACLCNEDIRLSA
tara:strand:+ start:167 stop:580 length:414 start_codon:yes stop_codon:yes gene_type:complete